MATFTKPKSIVNTTEYCGGCGHGVIQRLIAESIEELGLQDKTIGVVDIACSYWSLDALDYDMIAGPHGRLAAVATGIKKFVLKLMSTFILVMELLMSLALQKRLMRLSVIYLSL